MPRVDDLRSTALELQTHKLSPLDDMVEPIRGNASRKLKTLSESIFFHFIDAKGKTFGADIGRRLKLAEINISGFQSSTVLNNDSHAVTLDKQLRAGDEVSVEIVFEMMVDRDMCNLHGTLHGGCAAYLVDPCSSAPLVALGFLLGIDGTGVSQSMNLTWHYPVQVGSKITIKATSMYLTGKIRTARCEIWSGNKLCVSAIHSTMNTAPKDVHKAKL